MSTPFKSALLALALTAIVPNITHAHGYVLGALKIGHPWSRPTPNGAHTAAGFLTITNTGSQPDRLMGGSSPAVSQIQVHQMSMDGDIMRMRELPDGLTLPPGTTVRLEPGGYHLMLIGPKSAFKVGDHIPATLKFAHAGSIKVEFHVQAAPPPAEDQAPMGKMDMH